MESSKNCHWRVIFLAVVAAIAAHSTVCAEPVEQSPQQLLSAIQGGGYVIYMRHGPTNHQQEDSDAEPFKNCTLQRNLSDEGRVVAAMIGEKLKEQAIPVASVLSSPYCRCKDTARITFGDYVVEQDLQYSMTKNEKESGRLGDKLKKMMLTADTSAGNAVFVGHTANLKDGLSVWPKPEGVWVIFNKQGGKMVYQGMITPDDWVRLHKERQ